LGTTGEQESGWRRFSVANGHFIMNFDKSEGAINEVETLSFEGRKLLL